MNLNLERISSFPRFEEGAKWERSSRFSHITITQCSEKASSSNCFLRGIYSIYECIKAFFRALCCLDRNDKTPAAVPDPNPSVSALPQVDRGRIITLQEPPLPPSLPSGLVKRSEDVQNGAGSTPLDENFRTRFEVALRSVPAPAALIAKLIQAQPSLAYTPLSTGELPIHYLARVGQMEILPILQAAGADLDSLTKEGMTPLGIALEASNIHSARRLIEAGCKKDLPFGRGAEFPIFKIFECGFDPSNLRASHDWFKLALHLIEGGADLKVRDGQNGTLFGYLFKKTIAFPHHQAIGLLKNLLLSGVELSIPLDSTPLTPYLLELIAYEMEGHPCQEQLRAFRYRMHPHLRECDSKVDLLFSAVETGNIDALRLFSDLNLEDKIGRSALSYALECATADASSRKMQPVVEFLLRAKVEVNKPMRAGSKTTPLHFAIEECLAEFIEPLMQARASLDAADDLGRIPIALAFEKAAEFQYLKRNERPGREAYGYSRGHFRNRPVLHFRMIEMLIAHFRLDRPMRTGSKMTLLHFAIEQCGGILTDFVDEAGQAGVACKRSPFMNIIMYLLPKVRAVLDDHGRYPLGVLLETMCTSRAHRLNSELIDTVMDNSRHYFITPVRQSQPDILPLHFAIRHKLTRVAEKLIASRRQIGIQNISDANETALSMACERGLFQTAARLIRAGASVNTLCKDNQGLQSTILHTAIEKFDHGFVKILLRKGVDRTITNHQGKTAFEFAQEKLEFARGEIAVLRQMEHRSPRDNQRLEQLGIECLSYQTMIDLFNEIAEEA